MIADVLYRSKDHTQGGVVSINGVSPRKGVYWSNLVSYVDQIDRLHPFLTVYETCEFAWKCRSGGTHNEPWYAKSGEAESIIREMDDEMRVVNRILEVLGLARVKDTFVGDQQRVRGVSGGEKKRVTVAEMLVVGSPVFCGDEISTGLDAATTYDITRMFALACRVKNMTPIISLLQPPPETVANFDELILVSEGRVIYAGPVTEVLEHFRSLGYEIPERMDVADWLQALPTKDGYKFLAKANDKTIGVKDLMEMHLSTSEFVDKFYTSKRGQEILAKVSSPFVTSNKEFVEHLSATRYANSGFESLKLLVRRELLLWWRDKYQIKAKIMQSMFRSLRSESFELRVLTPRPQTSSLE